MSNRKDVNLNTLNTLFEDMPSAVKRMIVGELTASLHDKVLLVANDVHYLLPHMRDVNLFEDDILTPDHIKGVGEELRQTFEKMDELFEMLDGFNNKARERLFEAGKIDEDGNFYDEPEGEPCPICGAKPGEPCRMKDDEGIHDGQTEAEDTLNA